MTFFFFFNALLLEVFQEVLGKARESYKVFQHSLLVFTWRYYVIFYQSSKHIHGDNTDERLSPQVTSVAKTAPQNNRNTKVFSCYVRHRIKTPKSTFTYYFTPTIYQVLGGSPIFSITATSTHHMLIKYKVETPKDRGIDFPQQE